MQDIKEINLQAYFKELDNAAIGIEKELKKFEARRDSVIEEENKQFQAAISINPKAKIKAYLETIRDVFSSLVAQAQGMRKKSLQKQCIEICPYEKQMQNDPMLIIRDAEHFNKNVFNDIGGCTTYREFEILQKASDIATRASLYLENFDSLYESFSHQSEYIQQVKLKYNRNEMSIKQSFADENSELQKKLVEISNQLTACKEYVNWVFEREKVSSFSGCSDEYPAKVTLGKFDAINGASNSANRIFSNGLEEPATLSLINNNRGYKDCNILVEWDGESENIYEFVRDYILKVLLSFPVKHCEINLVSFAINQHINRALSPIIKITNNNGSSPINSIRDYNSFREKLKELKSDTLAVDNLISGYEGIWEYNEIAADPKPARFVILHDYPNGYNNDTVEIIKSLIDANYCGVYFILINNNSIKDNNVQYREEETIKDLFSESLKIEVNKNGVSVNGKLISLNLFDINAENIPVVKGNYLKTANRTKTIYINELFDYIENDETEFDETGLSIPFGKNGAEIHSIKFGKDNDAPITIIAGVSGSGKSSLLHSIILSGAYKYSPNELQFYLADLKQNVEFNTYKEDSKIPHVRAIANVDPYNPAVAMRGFLQSIFDEMVRRNKKIFPKLGVTNFVEYNKAIENQKHIEKGFPNLHKIPRLIVLIDEYEVLYTTHKDQECCKLLIELTKQARSAGFSIILASQGVPIGDSSFESVMQQCVNKISLACKDDAILRNLFRNCKDGRELSSTNIKSPTGSLYFSYNDGECLICRSALPVLKKDNESIYRGPQDRILAKHKPYDEKQFRMLMCGETSDFDFCEEDIDYFSEEDVDVKNNDIEIPIGISVVAGVPMLAKFNANNRVLYMIGNDALNKNTESLLLIGLLQKRRTNADYLDSIEYIDFCKDDPQNCHNGLSRIFGRFSKLVHVTEPNSINDVSPCYARLEELFKMAKNRDRSSKPTFVFLSFYDYISYIEENEKLTNDSNRIDTNVRMNQMNEISEKENKRQIMNALLSKINLQQANTNSNENNDNDKNESRPRESILKELIEKASIYNMCFIIHIDEVKSFKNSKISSAIGREMTKIVFNNTDTLLEAIKNSLVVRVKDEQAISQNDNCAVYFDGKDYQLMRRAKFDSKDNEKLDAWFDRYTQYIENNN